MLGKRLLLLKKAIEFLMIQLLIKNIQGQIELVRRQYSGNEHGVVGGIGIVNCLYFNPHSSSIMDDRLSYLNR